MPLRIASWQAQTQQWPTEGRYILAQYDAERVVVYQAYNPAIARFAARNGYFGGEFSLTRMSWIKPNFLWMMYRCGWASKPNQDRVLAVSLRREAFDRILREAVASTYDATVHTTVEEWQKAVSRSSVRLQWDPDHGPNGEPLNRRAIQLGMRGDVLRSYAREWLLDIEDITDFVQENHQHLVSGAKDKLQILEEQVYPVDTEIVHCLGMKPEEAV